MTDVDAWICSQELGFVLKSEQREALELLLRERMFCVFYQQDLTKALFIRCLFMPIILQVPCNGRPSLLSRLAAKMLLVPMNQFLCRVDYALEENILTEQM